FCLSISYKVCNKRAVMQFNAQRKLMNLLRFPLLWSAAALAVGISTGAGQTNGPGFQNGPPAVSGNAARARNVRSNNPQHVQRGPGNIAQQPPRSAPNQIQNQRPNYPGNYPRYTRQLDPTLPGSGVRQHRQTYNLRPSLQGVSQAEIARTATPVTDPQRVVKTDDLEPSTGVSRQGISEGLETAETQRVAKNDSVEPTARDLANGQVRPHKEK